MKKKFLSLLLALAMCLSLSVPAWAAVIENDPIIEPNGPQYHYKTEYLPRQAEYFNTLADNQDPEGAYLTSQSTVYYTPDAGSTVDKTFSVSLPHPFNMVTIGISAGRESSGVVGYGLSLNSTQSAGNYFLIITKHYYIDPFVVYRKAAGAADIPANWEIDHVGYTSTYRYHSAALMTPEEAEAALKD